MSAYYVILFIQFFTIKHFIVDYVLQTPYQYLNKGNLKHAGGYVHAALHGLVSFSGLIVLSSFVVTNNKIFSILLYLCLFESVSHYFIDYAKLNINKIKGWNPTTHNQFWILLGLDQLLHFQVYIFMIYFIMVSI